MRKWIEIKNENWSNKKQKENNKEMSVQKIGDVEGVWKLKLKLIKMMQLCDQREEE